MVKATVRKPANPVSVGTSTPSAPRVSVGMGTIRPAPAIDVESTVVKTDSATELADQLEAGTSVVEDGAVVPASEVAVAPRATLATARAWSGGGFEGDWDEGDTKLPQLKIVNGSGELSKEFNQGTLLYADEKLWSPPNLEKGAKNPEMFFVPLRIDKQFRENLTPEEVDDGLMPRVVASREEAERLTGEGSTQWLNNEKPKWSPSAKCVLLMQANETNEHPGFCTPKDDKIWAMAVYYCSGTAYNHVVKTIRNTAQLSLRENGQVVLAKKIWSWEVVKAAAGKFTVFVPKVRLTKEESGPEVRELADSLNGKTINVQE